MAVYNSELGVFLLLESALFLFSATEILYIPLFLEGTKRS